MRLLLFFPQCRGTFYPGWGCDGELEEVVFPQGRADERQPLFGPALR